MTSQKIKFYKFNSSENTKINGAKSTEGAIIYIVDAKELWIGGSTPKLVLRGTNDVTYNSTTSVLTVTSWNNSGETTTQTLDFSDVASSSATLKVFEKVYGLMGTTAIGSTQTLDYSSTNYLTSATNLVNADKALDTAIHTNTHKGAATGAVYDTQHLSQTWTTVVSANAIAANDTLDADIDKLDKKIAGLADEVIANEQVTQEAFTTVANSVGLESDMTLDLRTASQTGAIHGDTDVKSALIHLDNAISTNQLDVQVDGTSILSNHVANINTEDTYNASTNKLATKATVTNAINALDVDTDKGAASISGSTITIKAVQQENGLVKDGGTTTINLDGTYDATDNKIATKSTVTTAINALNTQSDVHDVVYTQANTTNGAKLTFKGVSETDGVIAQGTGTVELQFAKVATTGAAADVSYTNTTSGMTATDVQAAIDELDGRVDSLVGGMRYNGDISTASATVNTTTGDVRPGDIYLASGAFTIGTTSVEAGDMIVYKGTASQSDVALTASNCTIIERETDTMVTAGDTLTDNYIVFGNGSKDVSVTSTVDAANYQVSASDLKTAITNANSALQTISKGTDGTYVTTTIGTKANNDQTVGVALKEGTVTYTAKSGDNPADLSVTSGNEGVLTTAAVTPIKNYVDATVSNVVSDLDVAEYQQASVEVDTTNHASTLKIKGIKEDDGKIAAATTTPTTDVAIDGEYNASTNKVATQTTVTNAINALNADVTSQQPAVATVEVVEANGVITTVNVTNVSAGVSYSASVDGSSAPNLTASTATGAVTGADISTIKSYIDDKSSMCWEEYD